MRVRRLSAQAGHFAVVARWLFDEWSPVSPFETLTSTHQALRERAGADIVPSCFVMESNAREVLGTASLVECDYPPRRDLSPWLADVYVASDERNQGCGSELVRYVESMAATAGIERLYLITRHQRAFYERLGWRPIGETDYHDTTAVLMQTDCRRT